MGTVGYQFYDGKLLAVVVTVSGPRDNTVLVNLLDTAYGRGVRPRKDANEAFWTGHKASAHYLPLENGDGYLRVSDLALDNDYQKYEKMAIGEEAAKM